MASQQQLPIVLYHYPYSPYARRVLWYLHLRGIPFYQCIQPPILPREDILRLGISHRRIPIMSIGRDIYLDSRLILSKLEKAFPPSSSSASSYPPLPLPTANPSTPELTILEPLFRSVAIDNGIFAAAAKLIPTTLPLTRDPKFQADRAEFFGPSPGSGSSSGSPSSQVPEALADIKAHFHLLESTILSDGRAWILNTPPEKGPTMTDLEAIWPLHWLTTLPGALPAEYISKEKFPKVFAWIERFSGAIAAAKKKYAGVRGKVVNGEEAEAIIRGAEFHQLGEGKEWGVEENEPIVKHYGLEKGKSMVEIWPADTGVKHRDLGVLVGLDGEEVVIEMVVDSNSSSDEDGNDGNKDKKPPVRVHAPRHGFRLRGVKNEAGGGMANL